MEVKNILVEVKIFFTWNIKKQSKKFLEGKSPPDFASEDFEVNYKGRTTERDLSLLAKKQLGLIDWN